MARLASAPKNTFLQSLPDNKKIQLALQWLRDNLRETAAVVTRLYFITKRDSVERQGYKKGREVGELLR
jgi:hypothetical protein